MRPWLPWALLLLALAACGGAAENLKSDPAAIEKRGKLELKRAIAAEKKGKNKAAKRHYLSAVELRPSHYKTHERASLFLRGAGEPKEALKVVSSFVERSPGDPRGYHLLSDVQFANGDNEAAEETLSELISIDDEDASAFHKRGAVRMTAKKVEDALADYQRAVTLKPKDAEYLTSLGFALSRISRKQSLEKAQGVLEKALSIDESNADANRLLGTVLRKRFKPKSALDFHVRAVELDPDSAIAYFELGITQNALGQNDEAESSLRESLELNPNDSVAWYALGEVLRITGKCAPAVTAYEEALKLDPKHPKAPNKLGVCLYNVGDFDKAEIVLTGLIQNYPDDPYPYFNLGMVYEKKDRPHAAIKALKKFIELAPSGDGDIKTAKRRIGKLERKIRRRY